MPDNELKPCECGSTLVDVEQFCGGPYRAYCFYCGRVGSEGSTREEAIESWNRRAGEE